MPVTFGSIGDIIAVSLLIKDIILALNESHGSASEFQQVTLALNNLDKALLEVHVLSGRLALIPEVLDLIQTIRKTVDDCRASLNLFFDKIRKYKCLEPNSSSTTQVTTRVTRKLQWAFFEKGEVKRFQSEVSLHSSSLNMLLATATVRLIMIGDEQRQKQLGLNDDHTSSLIAGLDIRLTNIEDQGQANAYALAKVKDESGMHWLRDICANLKTMMYRIIHINIATYRVARAIQTALPAVLERSMVRRQEPILLEDPLGRVAPIHLEVITTWEMFDTMLELRFAAAPGLRKVKQKEYALQARYSIQQVTRDRPFNLTFLPGQLVDMSFIFEELVHTGTGLSIAGAVCPRCQHITDTTSQGGTTCDKCGMIYRRVQKATPPSFQWFTEAKLHEKAWLIGHKRKRSIDDVDDDDALTQFKRVQLYTYSSQSINLWAENSYTARKGSMKMYTPASAKAAVAQEVKAVVSKNKRWFTKRSTHELVASVQAGLEYIEAQSMHRHQLKQGSELHAASSSHPSSTTENSWMTGLILDSKQFMIHALATYERECSMRSVVEIGALDDQTMPPLLDISSVIGDIVKSQINSSYSVAKSGYDYPPVFP